MTALQRARRRAGERGVIGTLLMIALAIGSAYTVVDGLYEATQRAMAVLDRSAQCHQAWRDVEDGTSLSTMDVDECRSEFQQNLQDAVAAAEIVPETSSGLFTLIPLADLGEQLSKPPPTADAPLPPDVSGTAPSTCEQLCTCTIAHGMPGAFSVGTDGTATKCIDNCETFDVYDEADCHADFAGNIGGACTEYCDVFARNN